MTFLKNKPFHFMLALIFTCATTKAIHADSIGVLKTPSQENSEVVVLGDKDFWYLERKEGVWHLMSCEGSSLCGEVDMNDIVVDKIASYLIDSDLESHIKDYCTPEKEDYLCELFASSLELAQRKTDRNWAVAWAGAGAGAWALGGAVALAGAGAGALAGAVALARTIFKLSKDSFIAQEDIKKIRMELRKILEENAVTVLKNSSKN